MQHTSSRDKSLVRYCTQQHPQGCNRAPPGKSARRERENKGASLGSQLQLWVHHRRKQHVSSYSCITPTPSMQQNTLFIKPEWKYRGTWDRKLRLLIASMKFRQQTLTICEPTSWQPLRCKRIIRESHKILYTAPASTHADNGIHLIF